MQNISAVQILSIDRKQLNVNLSFFWKDVSFLTIQLNPSKCLNIAGPKTAEFSLACLKLLEHSLAMTRQC